jgi:amino acid adenylation domain-containing protein
MTTIRYSVDKLSSGNSTAAALRSGNDLPVSLKHFDQVPDRAAIEFDASPAVAQDDPGFSQSLCRAEFPDMDGQPPNWFPFRSEALKMLGETDRTLFEKFGCGKKIAPDFPLVHAAFEYWASVQPDALAAVHLGDAITYRELDRQAARLAALLLNNKVQPGDKVALFLRRSIPMLIGIMACLKIGAAYVPADVKVVPGVHLKQIAQTAKIRVVLTTSSQSDKVPDWGQDAVFCIDEIMAAPICGTLDLRLPRPVSPQDNCFVLFTSGTTGTPNGVQVTHANVCNILLTSPGNLGMGPGLKVSQLLSIGFDMAAWEILGALANGATLVIRGADFINAACQADIIIATPSVLSRIDVSKCSQVKSVAVAGEPCPKPLADTWAAVCDFYNSCGPTETTIVNTMHLYDTGKGELTIGRPTPNNTVYILDEKLNPCRIGETGEMWAGGACVTKGYLENDELNADRYRPDPFIGGDARMFRTRDLGRWTPSGELEHLGRTDDQVKIRGFRVELDSVSAVIERAPGVSRAVTLKLDDRNLVSFFSPVGCPPQSIRELVASALPYYCVPTEIFALGELPTTPRGKVDKHSLLKFADERINGIQMREAAQ